MIYANDFDYTPNKDNAFSKMGVWVTTQQSIAMQQ
jgi:3'-phosphoadenosine 5'-phosphosulfate sulfotransferase (PAPS reductase)/FAD synthetase